MVNSPPVKYFTDRSKAVLLLWILCFCSVLCLLCFVCVCLYVLCGHLLGKGWPLGFRLCCLLWVCHLPIGILGQVWYLIVSIPDLCNLTYFARIQSMHFQLSFTSISVSAIWYMWFLYGTAILNIVYFIRMYSKNHFDNSVVKIGCKIKSEVINICKWTVKEAAMVGFMPSHSFIWYGHGNKRLIRR